MSSRLGEKSMAEGMSFGRLLLPMHAVRLLAYQIVVVVCQYCTGLGVAVLMAVEVGKISWMAVLRKKGVLKSTVVVIAEGNQSLFLVVFLLIAGVVHPYGSRDKVGEGWQSLGRYTIMGAIGCEYLILVAIIYEQVVDVWRKRQQANKERKRNCQT